MPRILSQVGRFGNLGLSRSNGSGARTGLHLKLESCMLDHTFDFSRPEPLKDA